MYHNNWNKVVIIIILSTHLTSSDIDECTMETADCVDGATCVNTDGSFTCMCPSGFSGDGRASPGGSGCTGTCLCLYLAINFACLLDG